MANARRALSGAHPSNRAGCETQADFGKKRARDPAREMLLRPDRGVATTLLSADFGDNRIQRQYAQALIDQGKISAALYVLTLLESQRMTIRKRRGSEWPESGECTNSSMSTR